MRQAASPGVRSAPHVGEWLSLVEHLVRDQGVGGSNPLSPTIKSSHISSLALTAFPAIPELGHICLPISAWLGRANLSWPGYSTGNR
jgi:hypothetical protein